MKADICNQNCTDARTREKASNGKRGAHSFLRTGLILAFWCGLVLLCWHYRKDFTIENIANYLPPSTFAAVLIMLVLFALKGIRVPIYGAILYAASGVLFPLPLAICVNIIGSVLMTSIPFFIGKKSGAELLDHLMMKNEKLRHLQSVSSSHAFLVCIAARIIGLLPSDLVGMYFGASDLRYDRYIVGTLVGMLPSVLTFSVMGMSAHDTSSPAFWIAAGCKIILMLGSFAAYLIWKKQRRHREGENQKNPSS